MESKTLVALDTDHIKQFVFATNKLKEIRGASSLLDHLNRRVMNTIADKYKAKPVYTNGGSGMFVVPGDEEVANNFGREIQQAYLQRTGGSATLSFAVQPIPADIDDIWQDEKVHRYVRLLHYRLMQEKGSSQQQIEVLPSHPFMRPCDACGVRYAEDKYDGDSSDDDDNERLYCGVCLQKRAEDDIVRKRIQNIVQKQGASEQGPEGAERSYIWERIIESLPDAYNLQEKTDRPSDFNKLQGISGGKDYMALIYADANQMGTAMDDLKKLRDRQVMAKMVDDAIYTAMGTAIAKHLPVVPGEGKGKYMFPFDILMIGGDDVMVVTPANVAIDVALTLAKVFYEETKKEHTLSIAVILAPVKYPFGLLHDLADSTLKYAKKESAKREQENEANETSKKQQEFDKTTINFVVVAGNTGQEFEKVMESLSRKHQDKPTRFYATLRPYGVEELEKLRTAIREGKKIELGHTKLHQLREAVLKKNLTTSVSDARAVLTNWREKQYQFVYRYVYEVAARYQEKRKKNEEPATWFPRLTFFPWFEDGKEVYRSPLLDFVELYDFIEEKGGDIGTKA